MPDLWKRTGTSIAFGALALLAVVSMVGDRRTLASRPENLPWWRGWLMDLAAPIQRAVSAPVDGVRHLWSGYLDLLDVREENLRLQLRVAELEEENLQFREALVASGHLQRIAEMRDDLEAPMLPGEVVGLDVSPWFRSVLVDRGRSHGVEAGQPVLTHEGVVGVVTAVASGAARTMLLLDRQSAIDGIVQRSRARGIVRGTGTGSLSFEFVVRGGDVQPGDVVITSGLDGVYPKGLRVGVVEEVGNPGGRLIQRAQLAPAVDFGRLEQVFVMLRRGRTMDLLYGSVGDSEAAGAGAASEAPPGTAARAGSGGPGSEKPAS